MFVRDGSRTDDPNVHGIIIMTGFMQRFLLCLTGLCALTAACSKKPDADMAATVNEKPITYAEVDKVYKRQVAPGPETASHEQTQTQRLEILRTMIDNEIMLQRAEKSGLLATDSEVDTKFTEVKEPFTQDQFRKQLSDQGMSADDLRAQIRKDLSIQKLVNKEITAKINITDADVRGFYAANRASFAFPEPQVRIAQIMVTPQQDGGVNLRNNKAQNDEQAKAKIEMLAGRLKQGEDFAVLAQNYSEDQATSASGGDLGSLAESSFDKTSPELKKYLLSMTPGQISGVLHSPDGYRIIKMISKEPAGQRDLGDPRVQQSIRNLLVNRKDQLLRLAYIEIARTEAKVVNALARQILNQDSAK